MSAFILKDRASFTQIEIANAVALRRFISDLEIIFVAPDQWVPLECVCI